MTKIEVSMSKVEKLRKLLSAASIEPESDHLSDEQFVKYSSDSLSEDEVNKILAHLETCDLCADRMEQLLEGVNAWQDVEGRRRLNTLQEQLLPDLLSQHHSKSILHKKFFAQPEGLAGVIEVYAYCPDCGRPNRDKSRYCFNCGRSLLRQGARSAIESPALPHMARPELDTNLGPPKNREIPLPQYRKKAPLRLIIPLLLTLIGVIFILYSTNPNQNDHNQSIISDAGIEFLGAFGGESNGIFGNIDGQFDLPFITYHNYLLFSTTTLGDKTISFGIMGIVNVVTPASEWLISEKQNLPPGIETPLDIFSIVIVV
jgi:hypothetical protein